MALSAISWLENCVYVCAPVWMCVWDRESELSPGDRGRGRCLSSYFSVVVLWGIALRVWCIHCCWNWLPNAHMLKCTHTHTHTHTLPGTRGLVFPAPVTFNEEERGVKGHVGGGWVCFCVWDPEVPALQAYWKLIRWFQITSQSFAVSLKYVSGKPNSNMCCELLS